MADPFAEEEKEYYNGEGSPRLLPPGDEVADVADYLTGADERAPTLGSIQAAIAKMTVPLKRIRAWVALGAAAHAEEGGRNVQFVEQHTDCSLENDTEPAKEYFQEALERLGDAVEEPKLHLDDVTTDMMQSVIEVYLG